jgi:hypothetical protein
MSVYYDSPEVKKIAGFLQIFKFLQILALDQKKCCVLKCYIWLDDKLFPVITFYEGTFKTV